MAQQYQPIIALVIMVLVVVAGIGLDILKKVWDLQQCKRCAAEVGSLLGIEFDVKKTWSGYFQATGTYQGYSLSLLTRTGRVSHNIIRIHLNGVTPISFMMTPKSPGLMERFNRAAHGEVTFGHPRFDELYTVNSQTPPELLGRFFTPEVLQHLTGPASPLGKRSLSVTGETIESSGGGFFEERYRAAAVSALLVDLAKRLPTG